MQSVVYKPNINDNTKTTNNKLFARTISNLLSFLFDHDVERNPLTSCIVYDVLAVTPFPVNYKLEDEINKELQPDRAVS